MITLVFRRRSPYGFSIEKLFVRIYSELQASGATVRRLELPWASSGILNVLRNAWFITLNHSSGILHVTGDAHYAALFRPFARTVITVHDCVVLQRGRGLRRFVFWLLWFGLPLRFAKAVTVISETTRRELLQVVSLPERKIFVIPNFVDPRLVPVEREFCVQRPRILHVGTTPNKNLRRVIDALQGISCTLVVVGPIEPALLAHLRASGVSFENPVGINDVDMALLYETADIISFPSTYEGFGMPILEGQAVGRPVLTSDLEPMRSVAGNGGALLVDPSSVESIRRGFLSLSGDPLLRAALVAAGRTNCAGYSLEAVTLQYRALYRDLHGRQP